MTGTIRFPSADAMDEVLYRARRLADARKLLAVTQEFSRYDALARENVVNAKARYDRAVERYTNPFGVNKWVT